MLADFYHLASSPLERVLPQICEKVLGGGDRLLVVAEPALLDQLDAQLWNYARDGFLPHGKSEGASPVTQPILLSSICEPLNAATHIALADGVWRDEALAFSRAFYFFDEERRDDARAAWRALADNDAVERRYWKQDEAGKWVQGP